MLRRKTPTTAILTFFAVICLSISCFAQVNVEALDAAAVTIKANRGQGSGSVVIKEVINADGDIEKVAFCLTAAHVIDTHRKVRTVIQSGTDKKLIEFSDPGILQELYKDGRRVGEVKMDAKVIRYSDADDGHDLALLMIYASNKFDSSVSFKQDKKYIPPKGMRVVHIGSSNGQIGSNSFTTGNISQTGRLLNGIGSGSGKIFDQTSAPAEPGSSGCMIVEEATGEYVGMLVRGGSSTFNFVVPVRRMWQWAEENGIEFILDDEAKPVNLAEILDGPIEYHPSVGNPSKSKEAHVQKFKDNQFFFKFND